MKAINTITTALLFALGTTAQADQKVTAKANDGSNNKFSLVNRIVLDLTKENPVVRGGNYSAVYSQNADIVLQMEDMADAVNVPKDNTERKGTVYDLSGRKVERPGKGIYIVDGKKVVLK